MKALRISWTETEAGWGQRPDGYSLHVTEEAAAEYLAQIMAALPNGRVPTEYSYPSSGWRKPALATPVEVPEGTELASELKRDTNVRVFRSFADDTPCGRLYAEMQSVKEVGEAIQISYGETPYSEGEVKFLEDAQEAVGAHVQALQRDM